MELFIFQSFKRDTMEENKLLEIQKIFFDQIKAKHFENNKLGNEVSDILEISKSAAYKKIRCETILTSKDYMLLASAFGVSLDQLVMNPETDFMVRRPNFVRDTDDLLNYLQLTVNELNRLASVPHEFFYAARDLPVFLFFSDPSLIRFKIAVWLSELQPGKSFSHYYRFVPDEIFRACKEFYNSYNRLNRCEIWSLNTLTNLSRQIEYYSMLGQLSNAEVSEINQSVVQLMDRVSVEMKQFEHDTTPWRIYEVDFLMMGSNGLVTTPVKNVAYVSYAGINYLRIDENIFCQDLQNWFMKQISNSTSLVASKKSRILFFQRLKKPFESQ